MFQQCHLAMDCLDSHLRGSHFWAFFLHRISTHVLILIGYNILHTFTLVDSLDVVEKFTTLTPKPSPSPYTNPNHTTLLTITLKPGSNPSPSSNCNHNANPVLGLGWWTSSVVPLAAHWSCYTGDSYCAILYNFRFCYNICCHMCYRDLELNTATIDQ